MNEFLHQKQKRERGFSVQDVLQSIDQTSDDIESLVIVLKRKGGEVETVYSWAQSLEALGMLEVAKSDVIDSMKI